MSASLIKKRGLYAKLLVLIHFKELFLNHPGVDAGLAASIFHTKQVDIRALKGYLRENGVEMRL